MRRKTPQEKKRLSLEKDRRNVYGEAPHAARKRIPLRKKLGSRATRHAQEAALPSAPIAVEFVEGDAIQAAVRAAKPNGWTKYRDMPLGEVIARKQWRRATPEAERSSSIPLYPTESQE